MSRFDFPDLPEQFRAFQEAVAWSSESRIVWFNTTDGGDVREANEVWGELFLRRIRTLGIDETRYCDLSDSEEWARQDVVNSVKQLDIRLHMRSRQQNFEDANVGWYKATRTQVRLWYQYVTDTYLKPYQLSLATVGDVIDMPRRADHDDRIEDLAVLDFTLNAVLTDTDEAAVGSWIESLEITSNLKNPGGEPLSPVLQWDNEVIP